MRWIESAGRTRATRPAARHPDPDQRQHRHRTTGCRPPPDRWRWRASMPAQDATVAAKLRAAGAVILGKTNLSEWANFRSTHSTSGWSSRGGQTRNPYALDRNPCGSSSGSGVAVAANLCAAAVGTETDGSIICPSQRQRHRRHQADAGPGQPGGHHPHRPQPGHRRADGAHRRRCGDLAGRARRT